MRKNKMIPIIIATSLLLIFSILLTSCATLKTKVHGENLMKGVKPSNIDGLNTDEIFKNQLAIFSFELLKKTLNSQENTLLSPLSVMLALGMTANGADASTLEQMETCLGGDISLSDLNKYLYTYSNGLNSSSKSKLEIANSIWFSDNRGLLVDKEFLQTNANYYDAAAYKSEFDGQTIKDINNWVKNNTDGMIDKILEEISDEAVMYLINAIVFDAKWEEQYKKQDISKGVFHAFDKKIQSIEFMKSNEKNYLEGNNFTGFIKPYAEGDYSFAAFLPGENITVDELIESIDGEQFLGIINNQLELSVQAFLPKFSYDYAITLNETLKLMGMTDAFKPLMADFSKIGESTDGNIFIEEVLHKTFISVDENGTKAGAATKVSMNKMSVQETMTVRLDRPFLYSIIDNKTGTPIFLGVLRTFSSN